MSLNYENYRGEIVYCGEGYAFMPATLGDVEQIAEMYDEIAINEGNYKVKLDPRHEESFSHTGGMFEIHTRDSIAKEIRCGNNFFAIAKNYGGKIAASFWFGPGNPHLDGFNLEDYTSCVDNEDSVVGALRKGTVAYPLELICRPGKLHNAAHVMFYTVFNTLRQNGYTHSLFEVYALRGYRYKGQRFPVDMLNQRSFDMSTGMGGKFIGSLPDFDVRLGQLTVTISPKVICCDYAEVLPALERELSDAGISITFN